MTTGFYIDMINVGQGDAFLLTLGGPQGDATVLIDAGPPSKGETVGEFLGTHAAGHLDLVIGTHLDIDHIGGIRDVAGRLETPCDPRLLPLARPRRSCRGG